MACKKCNKRKDCKEICQKIEKELPKMNNGRMGGKLTIVSPEIIETKEYRGKETGKRRKSIVYNDNWEIQGNTP